jgi:hypothetical protein
MKKHVPAPSPFLVILSYKLTWGQSLLKFRAGGSREVENPALDRQH